MSERSTVPRVTVRGTLAGEGGKDGDINVLRLVRPSNGSV